MPLIEWLSNQAKGVSYGDVQILIRIHDGRISFVEKTVAEKSKLPTGNTGGAYEIR